MRRILQWEFTGLFKSGKFVGTFILMLLIGASYIGIGMVDGVKSGFEGFIGASNFVASSLYLVGPVFAGIYFTTAFQERMIQSAVMAGNSRFKIVISKCLGYYTALIIFILCPILIATLTMTGILGAYTIATGNIILVMLRTVILVVLVNIATMSVCIPISFFAKSIGLSIAINVGVILIWNGLTQSFIANPQVMKVLQYTSMGQSFLMFGELSGSDILRIVVVSAVTIFASVFVAYIKFRKEELK
jgi:ABC-type transport system involved in multi-copper enzyme maturation permease subunit